MSTSFQPAEWDFSFFQQIPGAAAPLWKLAPQHVRIQPVSQGVPMTAPGQWDFSTLDAILMPVLSVGDHSPELQLATAPAFMNDAQGHILPSHFQDFADYCANVVRYYNKGGFDAGGKHYQSPSPYPITWWGIFNEPNGNGVSAGEYVTLYNVVVPAMQAADPSIKFVAIELSDYQGQSQIYLPPFVSGVKAQVDVVATHYYSSCNQQDTDENVMSTIAFFVSDIHYLYSQLQSSPALTSVPVWVTENNENADYDQGNGISACNGTPFMLDTRGTSAFFAAWRPYLFSRLANARVQSLYHWDYDADAQFGEVDYGTGNKYLSYWVDYYLAHLFPSPPGADILRVDNSNSGALEVLAVRNDDGSVVVMLANHQVRSSSDNNGPGVAHTVDLDISALGKFSSAAEITIDASTSPANGPTPRTVTPAPQMQVTLNGYGVVFLRLNQATPEFPPNGVGNAASYASAAVSPGEIVDVFGQAMGPGALSGAQFSSPGVVGNFLAGTRVWFERHRFASGLYERRSAQRHRAVRGRGKDDHTNAGRIPGRLVGSGDATGGYGDAGDIYRRSKRDGPRRYSQPRWHAQLRKQSGRSRQYGFHLCDRRRPDHAGGRGWKHRKRCGAATGAARDGCHRRHSRHGHFCRRSKWSCGGRHPDQRSGARERSSRQRRSGGGYSWHGCQPAGRYDGGSVTTTGRTHECRRGRSRGLGPWD